MKLVVAWMGKAGSPAVRAGTDEYLARLRGFRRYAAVEGLELAGKDPATALLARARNARLWLLDPAGKSLTSPAFAAWLEKEGASGRELIFAVGGADGFPPAVQSAAAGRISLSPLTFSHGLARVVALEQLYRALALLTHHPYPH